MSGGDWISANHRLLVAEFARIKARLAGEESPEVMQELEAARTNMPSPAAIDVLAELFALTPFERDVLLLCAGFAMSDELRRSCGPVGSGHMTPNPSFGLAMKLEGAHWSAFTPIGPLRRLRLLRVHDELALTSSRVSIEERVLHYLAGINFLDSRLSTRIKEAAGIAPLSSRQRLTVQSALQVLDPRAIRVIQLVGDDRSAQREIARRIAEHYGLRLRLLSMADIPTECEDSVALASLWSREAALLDSALLIEGDVAGPEAAQFTTQLAGLVFVAVPHSLPIDGSHVFAVERPNAEEQVQLWRDALGGAFQTLNGSIEAAAAQFRLTTSDVAHAASALGAMQNDRGILEPELWKLCRERLRDRLDDLAQRIDPIASWDDLVLPDTTLETLRQIAAHARHRIRVHDQWGFAKKCVRGLGISVLFSGESGTGKTLAAEVLANDLRLDLYRIDLSAMVSKYIGETEKNLRRVFDAAQASGAILLFDEADALFGKRSEVKNSHDRYANIEVSYLLQRMEAYRGLAILTTNLKGALDTAFQRRLQFVVQFPFPDFGLREKLWRGVFPDATPLKDVAPGMLARLNVAGGSIRSIALNAAFLAAEDGVPVSMAHLLRAAQSEANKRDRPFSDTETRGWA